MQLIPQVWLATPLPCRGRGRGGRGGRHGGRSGGGASGEGLGW